MKVELPPQGAGRTEWLMRILALPMTEKQLKACLFLERQGQRFCLDFGYANAEDKVREYRRAKRQNEKSANLQ